MASDWALARGRPTLSTATVDVWRARLQACDQWVCGLLSEDELARAARLVREQDRERWAGSRAILRALLGRYLGVDGREIRFVRSPDGKPALAGRELFFNLSHSDEVAVYAFCRECEVGVDVEHARRVRDPLAVARRVLGQAEERRLRALEPRAQKHEFIRSWARYEAVAKCLGTGIPARSATSEAVSVVDLDLGPGAAAALAVAGDSSLELRLFEWSG